MACGHPGAAPPPLVPVSVAAAPADACILTTDSTAPPSRLDIAVPDVVGFVQRQVYETLIRFDCNGSVKPGLAETWASDLGGRRWTFTLRPAARFSDGTPATGADVFAALTRDSVLLDRGSVTLEGHDQVSVRFAATTAGVPPVFADTSLAVTRRAASSSWLLGTGVATADTTSGVAIVTPLVATAGWPIVAVRSDFGGDARDLLDHGIDVLVTGDPEVLSYAARRGDLQTVPLPWNRVYTLVSVMPPPSIGDTLRGSLARDVVRTDARPARGSYWWRAGPACPARDTSAEMAVSGSRASAVVYYRRDDPPARDLAERLVALGFVGAGGRAAGLGSADFDARLGSGGDWYLVALPRAALAPCSAVADLVSRAPWLSHDPGGHITALVETREHAIVRRGGSVFTVDWDGTLRLR